MIPVCLARKHYYRKKGLKQMSTITVFDSNRFNRALNGGERWLVSADVKPLEDAEKMTIDSTEGHSGGARVARLPFGGCGYGR